MKKEGITKIITIMLSLTLIVGMVFVFSVCVSAAPKSTKTVKGKNDVFKVGIIGPLSGPAKVWGQGIVRGLEIAIDEINEKGGLRVKGKNYKVVVKAYDDKYKGSEGATAANNLIFKDNVKFIFGSIATTSVLAFQVITEPNKVLAFIDGFFKGSLSPKNPSAFVFS